MRLTVVGPAASYTQRPGRPSSCYLVEHGSTSIALDFGQGSFAAMSAYRSPETLNAVFISHLHADHNVDLIPLRHFVFFERDGRAPALFGPADLRARFDAFLAGTAFEQFPGGALEAGVRTVGELSIEVGRVTHIPDSFAFRVARADGQGPGLVYSGDCGVADDLLPLIRATDTLLCEAAWGTQRPIPGIHLTAGEAGDVARRGGARRLLLTHILDQHHTDETLAAAREAFGGGVAMAQPGMTLDIG